MGWEHDYERTTVAFEAESAPEVVETVEIEGQQVAIVRYATLTMPTRDSAPVFGRTDYFAAIPIGAEIRTLTMSFYVNTAGYHRAGDMAGGFTTACAGDRQYARCSTAKATIKAARERIERDRLYAQYAPVAEANIGSHTAEQFDALDADAEIEPGDLVVVVSHGKYRTGVAVKVRKTLVECLAATPTGGVANGATRTKGTEVRLLRKATPATPAPAAADTRDAERVAARRAAETAATEQAERRIEPGRRVSGDFRGDRFVGTVRTVGIRAGGVVWAVVDVDEPITTPAGRQIHGVVIRDDDVDRLTVLDAEPSAPADPAPVDADFRAERDALARRVADVDGRVFGPGALVGYVDQRDDKPVAALDLVDAEGWGLANEEGPESRDCVRVYVRRAAAGGREQWCATHRTYEAIEDEDEAPAEPALEAAAPAAR